MRATLALDLIRAVDPAALAADIGMVPDPWQEDVLWSDDPRILLNCHRQSGKSTVAAVLAVHAAVYEPRSLVLLISPSQRQSSEVFRKAMNVYQNLGRPVIAEAENALSLILENGSRVISLPGNVSTVRGYSGVRLVVVDEAAFTSPELTPAVRPMLAVSGGRFIALSTPNGKQGWFYEAWVQGGWKKVQVPVTQCPRIPKEFLREEKLALGERRYSQEYLCEFVDVTDQAFGEESVKKAFDRSVNALDFNPPPEAEEALDLTGPVS